MPDPLDYATFTRQHRFAILVCALGSFCDVVEITVGTVLSSVYSVSASGIKAGQLSWLLAAPYAGAVFATPLFGLIADRFGRRSMLIAALSMLAISSFCSALSTDIHWLVGFRALSGIAIGSYAVSMAAYLAEVLPVRTRGRTLLFAYAIGAIGWPAALLCTRILSSSGDFGADAWRFICGAGAIGAVITALLAMRLPESPRWLRAMAQNARADAALENILPLSRAVQPHPDTAQAPSSSDKIAVAPTPLADKLQTKQSVRRAALIGALWFLSPWSTAGFPLLSGAMLISRGFLLKDSLLLTGISALGAPVGLLAGSAIVERMERRTALVILASTMAGAALLFSVLNIPLALLGIALLFTLCLVNYNQVLNMYVAEIYPTRRRAFAVSACWTVNRIASVLVPLLLVPLLQAGGTFLACAAMAGTMLASTVVLGLAPKGRAGQSVA